MLQDRHLVHQGTALAHWAAGAVKANAERQLETGNPFWQQLLH